MTICIAAMCRFIYPKKSDGSDDIGYVVLTASDRMLTDEGLGVEYEPVQGKFAFVAKRVLILCADNLAIHSDLLARTHIKIAGNLDISVREVAGIYSDLIAEYRQENAEKEYLKPFGLTSETFIEKNKYIEQSLVTSMADKILNYNVDVQALIVGCDADGRAGIFSIDDRGVIRNHSDIGFVTIGIGHFHANSYLMERSYWNGFDYWHCAMALYEAKKRAEIAPGVGKNTDMFFISRDGFSRLDDAVFAALEHIHPTIMERIRSLEEEAIKEAFKYSEDKKATTTLGQDTTSSSTTFSGNRCDPN